MISITHYSNKVNQYLKNINKINYKEYNCNIKSNNNNCWYCGRNIINNLKFCSLFCEKVYNSNDYFNKSTYNKITMFPFEYLKNNSKKSILKIIENIDNIDYDDLQIMFYHIKKTKFNIKIRLIKKFKYIYDINQVIKIIINCKIYNCVYCDSDIEDHEIYLKNSFFFIGYFCSNFCLESFIFRNKYLPFEIDSKFIICGKEYFEDYNYIKENFKNKIKIYTTIINNKISLIYNN